MNLMNKLVKQTFPVCPTCGTPLRREFVNMNPLIRDEGAYTGIRLWCPNKHFDEYVDFADITYEDKSY